MTYTVDENGCWVWPSLYRNGYARVYVRRKPLLGHRVMYELHCGAIPEGLDIDHLCRNRACVNPEHLQPVTRAENLRRGHGTKLTEAAVREIRAAPRVRGSAGQLAEKFGVTARTVYKVRYGQCWKDV